MDESRFIKMININPTLIENIKNYLQLEKTG